jgi:hypothetical protein
MLKFGQILLTELSKSTIENATRQQCTNDVPILGANVEELVGSVLVDDLGESNVEGRRRRVQTTDVQATQSRSSADPTKRQLVGSHIVGGVVGTNQIHRPPPNREGMVDADPVSKTFLRAGNLGVKEGRGGREASGKGLQRFVWTVFYSTKQQGQSVLGGSRLWLWLGIRVKLRFWLILGHVLIRVRVGHQIGGRATKRKTASRALRLPIVGGVAGEHLLEALLVKEVAARQCFHIGSLHGLQTNGAGAAVFRLLGLGLLLLGGVFHHSCDVAVLHVVAESCFHVDVLVSVGIIVERSKECIKHVKILRNLLPRVKSG